MAFVPHNNFDSRSFKASCPVTGLGKQGPAHGNNGGDDFIFRGPEITFHDGRGLASLGHFDLRTAAIRDAAVNHLGMFSNEDGVDLENSVTRLQRDLDYEKGKNLKLQDALDALVLQDAEYVVQLRALELELQEAYRELYEDFTGEADLA